MYSCALWADDEGGVRGDLTHGRPDSDLEAAQQRKIHHVLKTARVKPGDRLLEFGTGWGGLAIEVGGSWGLAARSDDNTGMGADDAARRLPQPTAAKWTRSRSL